MTEEELFTEALRRPSAAEQDAYLDGACAADPAMRRRIGELLAAHRTARQVFDRQLADLLGDLAVTRDAPADPLAGLLGPSDRPGALGRLGHYDVLAVLGRGGFGIVARAFDTKLQRVVAVKVLDLQLAATSPPRRRFLREARAAAGVKNDHVVQVHAVEEEPVPYLVMEFVDGPTLQQKLDAAGPLPAAEAARLGRQIALGLAAAHEQGLIHRDVKPANVLLEGGPEPRAKLTDFGLARAADDASLTQSGVLAGTPQYMAPEQVKGAVLDGRADLFSLGSVLYTVVAGHPPFRAATSFAVMKRVAEDVPRSIREVNADVPPGLAAVIERLMAKDPADRYGSAREAAEALANYRTTTPAPLLSNRRPLGRWLAGAAAFLLLTVIGAWGANGFRLPVAGESPVPTATPEGTPRGPQPSPAPAVFPSGAIVVTGPADNDTPGTLRWAVAQANVHHGEDAIVFDPAAFDKPTTITLTRGPLEFFDPARTTITGPPGGVTVSGGGRSRVFTVGSEGRPASARLADLTVANGRIGAGTDQEQELLGGGCLLRTGSEFDLVGCTVRDCRAFSGGGVFNFNGTMTLVNCTFARNTSENEGGGARTFGGAAVSTVTNCTFVGNAGSWGGGHMCHGAAKASIWNSLFANNTGGGVVDGDGRTDGGSNLSDDGSLGRDDALLGVNKTDPRVGPLGRYGGPTETIPLVTGSPALDAGDNDRVPAGVRTDQRGKPRIGNGRVDIGAFEAK